VSTLVDWQIAKLCNVKGLISPYTHEQLNPASYDVLLGDEILLEVPPTDKRRTWLSHDLAEAPYILAPGEFILGSTSEVVNVPEDLEAVFCLKSSRGREGYDHALAAYIDPGFVGRVTLELHNMNRFHDLVLTAGMRIGQLRFASLSRWPERSYSQTGRYQGDMGPSPSRG
jgi:dCTP deaminase